MEENIKEGKGEMSLRLLQQEKKEKERFEIMEEKDKGREEGGSAAPARPKVTAQPRGAERPRLEIYLLTLSSYRGSLYGFLEIRLRLMTLLRLPFPAQ